MPGIIGVPNIGALSDSTGSGNPYGSIWAGGVAFYTAVAGDVVSTIEWYGKKITDPNAYVRLAVYTVVAVLPAVQVHTPVNIYPGSATPSWWSLTGLSISLTAGVTYCICGYVFRRLTIRYFASPSGSSNASGLFALPNPWTHIGYAGQVRSMRAIVTGSGAGGVMDHRRGAWPVS